jgi:hypothetical protein
MKIGKVMQPTKYPANFRQILADFEL